MDSLAQKAISAALRGDWKAAEKLNQQVLEENPKDIDALNRLAHAQEELGKRPAAAKAYKKVLRLDRYNNIAQRALTRLQKTRQKQGQANSTMLVTSFLEEPGKTKTVSLIHLGDELVLGGLDAGQQVKLSPHRHRVSVETEEGKYIGRLPDDLSRRIIRFVRAGNEYKSLVKGVSPGQVKVFIKETQRAPELADTPSFPQQDVQEDYISFTSPDLIYEEKPEVSSLEDEGEEA